MLRGRLLILALVLTTGIGRADDEFAADRVSRNLQKDAKSDKAGIWGWDHAKNPRMAKDSKTLDWRPSCNCIGGADMTPRPGRVLDPFSGSGRTGAEANRLGLDFTGCELNPDFCAMSTKILIDQSPLFNGLS